MSTRLTILHIESKDQNAHDIVIHAYREMHESPDVIKFEIRCGTCYCDYSFIMTNHIGEKLIEILKKGSE